MSKFIMFDDKIVNAERILYIARRDAFVAGRNLYQVIIYIDFLKVEDHFEERLSEGYVNEVPRDERFEQLKIQLSAYSQLNFKAVNP